MQSFKVQNDEIPLLEWKLVCPVHGKPWMEGLRGHWHAMRGEADCKRSALLVPMLRSGLRDLAWERGWNKKQLNEWLKAERGGTFSALNTDAKIEAVEAMALLPQHRGTGSRLGGCI